MDDDPLIVTAEVPHRGCTQTRTSEMYGKGQKLFQLKTLLCYLHTIQIHLCRLKKEHLELTSFASTSTKQRKGQYLI